MTMRHLKFALMTRLVPMPPTSHTFNTLQVGDFVCRCINDALVPAPIKVIAIKDGAIYCCPPKANWPLLECWTFDLTFGYEIDKDLGWGVLRRDRVVTGSYLLPAGKVTNASSRPNPGTPPQAA